MGVFCAQGVEANASAGGGFFYWDDVPDLVRSDVGGDEVDVAGRILTRLLAAAVASGGDAVSLAVGGKGRFDLDAQQATVSFDYEVVGFAVSVGLAYGESEAGRFDYEYEFYEFAFAFGGAVNGRGRPAAGVARLSGSDLGFFRHRTRCWRFGAQLSLHLI